MKIFFILMFTFGITFFLGITQKTAFCVELTDNSSEDKKKEQETFLGSSDNTFFSVSTDEQSATESLNRIAGEIDRGFSSSEQTYKSDNQYKPGLFARSEAKSSQDKPSNY